MANIKFDTHGTHTTSYTKCQFGKPQYVGSVSCSSCEFHVITDDEEEYVICNADGSMNQQVHLTTAST